MIFTQYYSCGGQIPLKWQINAFLSYKHSLNTLILCKLCNYVTNIQNYDVQFVQFSFRKVLTYAF